MFGYNFGKITGTVGSYECLRQLLVSLAEFAGQFLASTILFFIGKGHLEVL